MVQRAGEVRGFGFKNLDLFFVRMNNCNNKPTTKLECFISDQESVKVVKAKLS